jgi:DNA (cytosine-5)-methyltransferase 1
MSSFKFIDLFAGIGGFHAALSAYGGECVYGVEIDSAAAKVYEKNWGLKVHGDITIDVTDDVVNVPEHDVLCAGFPCQPFSKSGAQRGMEETRGTLYWSILKIIRERRPALVVLENVRNLAGPRHVHEWQVIIETLRAEKYRVSEEPAVFSPHLLPRHLGGRPQVRERVFIVAVRDDSLGENEFQMEYPVVTNQPVAGWEPNTWHLESDLPLDGEHEVEVEPCKLNESEKLWIDAWDDFVVGMWELREGRRLPGFPLWGDDWVHIDDLEIPEGTPAWKSDFLRKNAVFYSEHQEFIDEWMEKWEFKSDKFPPSRRKLEWQAQDTPRLWDTVMHFRPSGIRAKRPTYLPALVAITQTSIVGSRHRRLSPREAARLQGLPDWFDFGDQKPAATYKQLGNGVSVGAVWHVVRQAVKQYEEVLKTTCPSLVTKVLDSPENPDDALKNRHS